MIRRVAVTGIGIISPLGNSMTELFYDLITGVSGIRRVVGPDYERLATRIAAPAAFSGSVYFEKPRLRMLDRVSQFALAATRQAAASAKLNFDHENLSRITVSIGTGMGGAQATDEGYHVLYGEHSDRINPYSVMMAMNNAPASWIGLEYGISGPNLTYSTACSSSAVAIGEAAMRIRRGEADVAIAGGTEAPLTFGCMKAWEAMRTLALEDAANPAASCKPFDRNRTGMVLGEGAAIVVLEDWDRAVVRNAPIQAELIGYGLASDPVHMTRPSPQGQARAMSLALRSAGIVPSAVGYINAHGSGTPANDSAETEAIKQVFGEQAYKIPISSTKSMHGHLLGAGGALEFAITVTALKARMAPPTMNLETPDPECDLDYVANRARDCAAKVGMSNSFAFGGTNAVLVVRAV